MRCTSTSPPSSRRTSGKSHRQGPGPLSRGTSDGGTSHAEESPSSSKRLSEVILATAMSVRGSSKSRMITRGSLP
jgi:hypothetical protein